MLALSVVSTFGKFLLALSVEASDSTIQGPLSVNWSCQRIGTCRLCSENQNFCHEMNAAKGNLAVALLVIFVGFCNDMSSVTDVFSYSIIFSGIIIGICPDPVLDLSR